MQQDTTIVFLRDSAADVAQLPRDAYQETYFSGTPYFQAELSVGRHGVAGDPVPYTSLLLGCFVLTVIAVARLKDFIVRQMRNFFRIQYGKVTEVTETSAELWVQFFLVVQTCLLFALLEFLHISQSPADAFFLDQHLIIGILTAIFLAYFLLKLALYGLVGWVFFEPKKNEQWTKFFLFLVSFEGLLMFPLVLLHTYFGLSMESATIYVLVVVILAKLLSFYRSYVIFFNEKGSYLKIILYLCTLEIIPLLDLWGILALTSQSLKVN